MNKVIKRLILGVLVLYVILISILGVDSSKTFLENFLFVISLILIVGIFVWIASIIINVVDKIREKHPELYKKIGRPHPLALNPARAFSMWVLGLRLIFEPDYFPKDLQKSFKTYRVMLIVSHLVWIVSIMLLVLATVILN